MPANSLLCAYLEEDARRKFVDSAAEVKVRRNEVIMRQGALRSRRPPAGNAAPRG